MRNEVLIEPRMRGASYVRKTIGQNLRRNCLLKRAVEGDMEGRIEGRRRRRRRKQLLYNPKEARG